MGRQSGVISKSGNDWMNMRTKLVLASPEKGTNMPNMGNQEISIADALFTRTQVRVLGILFGQPARSFYLNEVLVLARGGSGAVRRELDLLVRAGLVNRFQVGNQQHYQVNSESPVFEELQGLVNKAVAPLTVRKGVKSVALGSVCRRHGVIRLTVFGSAARGDARTDSDIDFIVEFATDRTPTLAGLSRLKDELESLYERRVDLATPSILGNPHRRKAIEKDMEVIYERKGSRVPVGHAQRRT